MSECETKFGVGDTVEILYSKIRGVIIRPHENERDAWWAEWDDDGREKWFREYAVNLVSKATPDPVVPLGGNDCCRKPLPDIVPDVFGTHRRVRSPSYPDVEGWIVAPEKGVPGSWWIQWDHGGSENAHESRLVLLPREAEQTAPPMVLNEFCKAILPAAKPAPAGYDLGVLEAVLSEAWGMLSAAHAGLICTPPETAAPTLVLSLAMEKIESLIGEVREALGEGGDEHGA